MTADRSSRVAAALQAELADLIAKRVKDPRVHAAGLLTVTEVRMSPDLKHATVRVSFVGGKPGTEHDAIRGLASAAGLLRGEIGRRLGMKRVPALRFRHDRSAEYLDTIDRLLKEDEKK